MNPEEKEKKPRLYLLKGERVWRFLQDKTFALETAKNLSQSNDRSVAVYEVDSRKLEAFFEGATVLRLKVAAMNLIINRTPIPRGVLA